MRRDRTLASSFCKLLNGEWRFLWYLNPAAVAAGFEAVDVDTSAWDTIPVPANWEMMGDILHGKPKYNVPHYTNVTYPFPIDRLPGVPEDDNPIGIYRRTFTVPDAWAGAAIFITFDGVDSAFYLWVNGKKVGYGPGQPRPRRLHDLTPYPWWTATTCWLRRSSAGHRRRLPGGPDFWRLTASTAMSISGLRLSYTCVISSYAPSWTEIMSTPTCV
ncbi:MAG: hypothetical protein R2854_14450 [Caldilineaceae bacterium]